MDPFGASIHPINFSSSVPAIHPVSGNGVSYPGALVLSDAIRGLGFIYLVVKGLKKAHKFPNLTKQQLKESPAIESHGNLGDNHDTGRIYRGLATEGSIHTRPIVSQTNTGFGHGGGNAKASVQACKNGSLGLGTGDNRIFPADSREADLGSGLDQMNGERAVLKSVEGPHWSKGLGFEGVVTTVAGLSQQVQYKKEFVTVVKVADGVVEGMKAANGVFQTLNSPVGDVLLGIGTGNGVVLGLKTVKIVLKGVKISKGLTTIRKLCSNKQAAAIGASVDSAMKSNDNIISQRLKAIVEGLKASDAVANIVMISKEVGKYIGMDSPENLMSWGVMMKGFKFTKSAMKVLAPISQIHWGLISAAGDTILKIKGTVEGIGVLVKACVLSKEVYVVIIKAVGVSKGATAAMTALSEARAVPGDVSNVKISEETKTEYRKECLCRGRTKLAGGRLHPYMVLRSSSARQSPLISDNSKFFSLPMSSMSWHTSSERDYSKPPVILSFPSSCYPPFLSLAFPVDPSRIFNETKLPENWDLPS
jgi:hypothetical protein